MERSRNRKILVSFMATAFLMAFFVSAVYAIDVNVPKGFKFGTYQQKPWAGRTINVAMVAEPRSDAIAKLASEFEKLTGIKVVFHILAYPTLQEKQMVALTQGTGSYDIVHVDCVWVGQYAGEGWTIPVEEFILRTDRETLALDDFIPAVVSEQGMWEDRIYGLPCIQAVFGLHYRTDIFKKYGTKVPQTWEELRETAKALHLKEPGVNGITFMGRRGVQLQCTYDNMLWSFGGEWYDEKYNPTINSKEAVEALEYFKTLIPYAPKGVLTYDWDENARAFAQGNAAMTIQWQNAAPTFYNPEKSKIVGKFEFTLVPGKKQPAGSIKRTPTFGGWSLQIPKDSKNKEAAWEFMVWASSRELDSRLAYSQPGSRFSGLMDPQMQKKYIEYSGMLEALPIAKGRPRIAAYSELADALEVALSEAMTGTKPSKKALDEANSKFKFILKKWDYLE
ncbi:MAG: extracellular solute-binding protein [Desulfobacterales bacterium]|nr:MAG: extracellular solute-binding protein [Desulfobacterales bacterium]